ncbi:MAG: tyrosine-type recombinase/integrase [gamma proteobacterium symbiont of Bathyaustriella thionipta]|nr:tyrosine-type recombinase/integrase [gamma proteobacterium symbiont of Bathyaustriella thionipta]MCU7951413.1 tyrosine-type recombinase/integrase [gamma proteobacterium symbiont of Bathyaustriella thionipta]MCU7953514.1 tyrosine-type recombinase/integrase [gamma proteobacterium symbiont of Bathyaustriella thionipta]MCU7957965.1 tyrosine-type recombinase/integrase [gamma proteobacterium symbiont of Bathyaustriella thionipta]MCU7968822.1 tyrosine-type recombinase/integrase [gamma proteobacteri
MSDWAKQDKWQSKDPLTWARRLKKLRPFARYLQQFEAETEVPDKSVFGSVSYRLPPHIYTDNEVTELLTAARHLSPEKGLRGVTYETLFGLLASTGMRVSEALNLLNHDVDLKHGMLTIRQTKFRKSRYVPLHPTTINALRNYYSIRNTYVETTDDNAFFIGSRGHCLGQPLTLKQVDYTFSVLRKQLNWVNRGGHHAPRIHDLRYPNLNKIQTFFKDA